MEVFSLRPRRKSVFPSTAAWVKTLVVSWKEAAEMIVAAKEAGALFGVAQGATDRLLDACEANGIKFIGPKAKTMRQLGDKASARRVAAEYAAGR